MESVTPQSLQGGWFRRRRGAQKGVGYPDAHDLWQRGLEFAATMSGVGRTVRDALEAVGCDADRIAGDVRLLERRDDAALRLLERETAALPDEQVSPRGEVMLGVDADPGAWLADPAEAERRWQRARRLPQYSDLPDGRKRFAADDRQYLEDGKDLLRSAERSAEDTVARGRANAAIKTLDRALREGRGKDAPSRMKLLDSAIRELGLGDEPEPGLRLLEAADGQPRGLSPAAAEIDRRVRARLAAEGADTSEYLSVLNQLEAGDGAVDMTEYVGAFFTISISASRACTRFPRRSASSSTRFRPATTRSPIGVTGRCWCV